MIWQPHPDKRIGWLTASLHTRQGLIRVSWRYEGDSVRYELKTPVETQVKLNGKAFTVQPGKYTCWG